MSSKLSCSIGQHSSTGQKRINQDSFGARLPASSMLASKGIAVALADGISSSSVSQIASQTAIRSFLEDYYCTSETWTVKTSAQRVLNASNSWLYAQNQRNHQYRLDKDKGYVCTFSAIIFKSNTAYLFHVGDAQIFRLSNGEVEPLSEPHRVWISKEKNYLARALGISQQLEIDHREIALEPSDVFIIATDGVYEHIQTKQWAQTIHSTPDDLEKAAKRLCELAIKQGSNDNVTVQIIRIEELPSATSSEYLQGQIDLPFSPELRPRSQFDGFEIIRDLHRSARSQTWLAKELDSGKEVVLKIPSTEGRQRPDYIERFLLEEWIANRINNAHVIKAHPMRGQRNFCYTAIEYIKGQTLAQWMIDNPSPSLDQVRKIVEQIAKGLYAFHRQEMLHQDLRPENVMIDETGTVKIIDFGSTFVSGINETKVTFSQQLELGTAQFLAPEYFLGEFGTKQSDLYSLACITYHLLCREPPYGAKVARTSTRADQLKLRYRSANNSNPEIPSWIDLTLKKGLQVDPKKRYMELSELIQDLRKPNPRYATQSRQPLIEQNPLRFWQSLCAILGIIIIILMCQLMS